ncbi:MAG: T9SS type A sorting domain-containing protein [Bacteroidetes bacterium]|nr:T9SS type A sorting domain-containing protein [Bacteroidota bacterium]
MKKIVFIIASFIVTITVLAQDYPLAPEIWSEPVLLTDAHVFYDHPTLNATLDTIYFGYGVGVYRSILVEGNWSKPDSIPQLIHGGAYTGHPSLSRDGKRIYHTAWGGYGSWDMYINYWIDSTKTWGSPINLGPVINSASIEWYAYEVSEDTLYIIGSESASLGKIRYIKDKANNEWVMDNDYYYTEYGDLSGLSISVDRKRLYFSQWRGSWDNYWERGTELCVSYWDSTKGDWGENYFLNINSEGYLLDSSRFPNTLGGWDGNPWISANGKVLFFASTRNVDWSDTTSRKDIFVSYLLVDENGDSVTTIKNDDQADFTFTLNQNYPNPFNPTTTINYTLNRQGFVELIVYDSLGRRIAEPIRQLRNKGNYKYVFDAEEFNLSSGIYYYQLFLNGNYIVKKMVLTK